jgi:hypothetical protein
MNPRVADIFFRRHTAVLAHAPPPRKSACGDLRKSNDLNLFHTIHEQVRVAIRPVIFVSLTLDHEAHMDFDFQIAPWRETLYHCRATLWKKPNP